MKRVLDAARIQTVNWQSILLWPLGILALAFAINVVLFGAIGDGAPDEERVTGAVLSIYMVVGIAYLQTMTQVFPFALGLGITRRAFYAATALRAVVEALFFGFVISLLLLVERATGGWGLNVRFFGIDFMVQDNLFAQWLVYAVPFLALSAVAAFMGLVFKRWGQPGVYVATIGTSVLAVGAVLLITWQQWWPLVGAFFTEQSTFALFAVYPLVIAAVLGAAGYLTIRRATP